MKKILNCNHTTSGWLKKVMMVMKIWSLLLIIGLSSVSASTFSQQKVSLNVKNKSLISILDKLQEMSEYTFLFSSSDIREFKHISFNVKDEDFFQVLGKSLEGTDIEYERNGNLVILKKKEEKVPEINAPQQKTIKLSGTVVDEQGNPMPGVTVIVKGTTTGMATDIDGNFSFTLTSTSETHILELSFVGMKKREVLAQDNKPIKVIMEEDRQSMNEVVVTGYQSIRSGRATGSYQVLRPQNMDNIVALDFTRKLEGQVPGLLINSDGEMLIRGKGTFDAETQPLIVVDGFPTESSTLNIDPNDIDQITVLKDAASASIYGVRGANGVIVVTTKRGGIGIGTAKAPVRVSANFQLGERYKIKDLELLSSAEHVDLEWELYKQNILTVPIEYGQIYSEVGKIYWDLSNGDITEDQAEERLKYYRAYNNEKELEKLFYRKEFIQQYNISHSGATTTHGYFLSLGFNKKDAFIKGNDLWRVNFAVNNDLKIGKRANLQFSVKANYYKENKNGEDVMATGIRPYVRILDEDGNYVAENSGVQQHLKEDRMAKGYLNWDYNRLENRRLSDNTTKGHNFSAILNLNYQVIDGLSLSTGFMYETSADRNENYRSVETFYARNLINRFTYLDPVTGEFTYHIPMGGILENNNAWGNTWTWRGQAIYSKTIGEFDFSLQTGLEFNSFRREGSVDYLFGYDPQALTSTNIDWNELMSGRVQGYNGSTALYMYETRSDVENRYASFFALANVTFKERYDLFGSYRLDKTNLFGRSSEYRDNPAYSIGAKWTLSSEPFFDIDFINRLAIKLSYGVSGNIDKSTSPYLIGYNSNDYYTSQPGFNPNNAENPLLTWEKSYIWNMGVEFALFTDRLTGDFEFYNKNSKDILAEEQMDYTSGWGGTFSKVKKNSANITNRGIELNLRGKIIDNVVRYHSGFNLSYNHNEVTKISRDNASVNDIINLMPIEGQPIDYVYAFRNAGLDETGEPMVYNKAKDEKYAWNDLNNLEIEDIKFVGQSEPPVFGSWTNDLYYKNFGFSFMFTYKLGHKIRLPYSGRTYDSAQKGIHKSQADRWRKEGDDTWVPKAANTAYETATRINSVASSDKLIEKGNIIRLKSINLSYDFSSLINNATFIDNLTLKISAENLFYWSKSGYDTDKLSNNTLSFPEPRRYTLGLNINF